jgi:hypothetical protein
MNNVNGSHETVFHDYEAILERLPMNDVPEMMNDNL